jgi:hypothetical protein
MTKMKKIKVLGLITTLIIIFFSCEDEIYNPVGQRNTAVIPAISDLDPGIFDSKDLLNTYIEFKISLSPGTTAEKVAIVASYEDNFERVTIKDVTTFPSTVKISASEVAQKLGISLAKVKNGDVFTFELLSSANGLTTRSNAVVSVPVACAYNAALATGSYHSVSSDWNSEGDITITSDPKDPYTVYVAGLEEIEGLDEDQGPLVMHINPATYEIIADETVLASDAWGYGSISYSGSGVYGSCDGSYIMYFEISLSALGSQGTFRFDFTRNK